MEGQICSQLEEIPKSQAKINEELFRFKDDISEEISKFRAQYEKDMADVHSKLDILIVMVHDRLRSEGIEPPDLVGAPLDQTNSNPEGPTLVSVADQLPALDDAELGSGTTTWNPIDELIPSEDDIGNNSAIKQSFVENGNDSNEMLLLKSVGNEEGTEKNNGNVDEEGVGLPLIDLQSFLGSLGDTTVKGSSKGSTKAWFEESTSGWKAVLSQNAIDPVAHKVFDETSQSFRAVLMDEQVNDPYTNGFNFSNLTLFDPGGGRKYAPIFSRGVVRPLIRKAPGSCINGMKGAVSSPRHTLATIVSGDKHCLIASNHFHIFSSGSHHIFALIVDSIAHGDDFTEMALKALFEEANYELLMTMLSFDPGGSSLRQMGCDPFGINGEQGDYCLVTIMADINVKPIIHKNGIMIASVFEVLVQFPKTDGEIVARALLKDGLGTYVEIGIGKMSYYVDDFFVDYSLDSKVLCKRNVVRSSSGKPFTPFSRVVPILELVVRTRNRIMVMALFEEGFKRVYCDMNSFGGNSNVKSTRESGSERLCDKGIDEILKNFANLFLHVYCKNLSAYFDWKKLARLLLLDKSEIDRPKVGILTKLQQQHGDKFMSETDGIAAYFALVCYDISSSSVCSCMVEFEELLHIRQLRIGSLRHDLIIIHVCWTKLAFSFLPSIQVTLPLDMNLELPTNISRLVNSLFALLHDMGKTNDMVAMVVLRVLGLYFEYPYDHAHNHHLESIEYSGWNTEKVTIVEQPLRNRKLADKINVTSGIPNTRRQLIQAEFVTVLNGVKEDVYFDDESTEVVKSLLRLGDHHETLFINSSWIDFPEGVTGDAIGMLEYLASNFVWDPGSIRIFHFTTLRSRWLLRGRICHVPRLKIRKKTEDAFLAVNDVICDVTTLCRISIIQVFDLLPKL